MIFSSFHQVPEELVKIFLASHNNKYNLQLDGVWCILVPQICLAKCHTAILVLGLEATALRLRSLRFVSMYHD